MVADNTNFAEQINEKCDENLYVDYSIRNTECAYQGVNYSSEIKDQSGVTRSKASLFNEFRILSTVLRTRKASRRLLSFVKPGYQLKNISNPQITKQFPSPVPQVKKVSTRETANIWSILGFEDAYDFKS
jgi:hypothetical protein